MAAVHSLGPASPPKPSPGFGSFSNSLLLPASCFGTYKYINFVAFYNEPDIVSNGRYMFLDSLENWYYRILIIMTGNLENARIAVDSLSIW